MWVEQDSTSALGKELEAIFRMRILCQSPILNQHSKVVLTLGLGIAKFRCGLVSKILVAQGVLLKALLSKCLL